MQATWQDLYRNGLASAEEMYANTSELPDDGTKLEDLSQDTITAYREALAARDDVTGF